MNVPIIPGKVTISRTTSNRLEDYERITIELILDRQLIRMELTPEEFGQAVTGLARRPCDVKVYTK